MIKNGKLFGKINVIDLLVALVIIAAIAAGVVFLFFKPQQHTDDLVMKFRIEEVDNFVAEKVHIGDALFDDSYIVDMGTVTDIEISDSMSFGGIVDNMYTLVSKEGYCSMIITGEVEGKKTDLGCEIAGKKYGVGHTFVLRAGDAKLYLRVYDIMLKEDYEKQQAENAEKTVETEKVTVEFCVNELDDRFVKHLAVGDEVVDPTRNSTIGVVKELTVEPSVVYSEYEGKVNKTTKEGYSAVTLVCEMEAKRDKSGSTLR